jgi:hypothetical protein
MERACYGGDGTCTKGTMQAESGEIEYCDIEPAQASLF